MSSDYLAGMLIVALWLLVGGTAAGLVWVFFPRLYLENRPEEWGERTSDDG